MVGREQMMLTTIISSLETARTATSMNLDNTGRKTNNTGRTLSFWPNGHNFHSLLLPLHRLLDIGNTKVPTKGHWPCQHIKIVFFATIELEISHVFSQKTNHTVCFLTYIY